MTADGRFAVSRGWVGTVEGGVPSWVGERFGVPEGWRGRIAGGYEVRFDSGLLPVRLRTVAERETPGRLHQVTSVLDLRDRDARSRAALLAPALTDALSLGPGSDLLFFGTGRPNRVLWQLPREEATLVTATWASP